MRDESIAEIAGAVERTIGRATSTLHRSSLTIEESWRLCELYESRFDERWWSGIMGHSARLPGAERVCSGDPVSERTRQAAGV